MSLSPTGTVTFLFTDIEGSTKLAQAHPVDWEAARQRHHAIVRESVEAHHGNVFLVIGDAFCVAFPTASDGLQAALAAQRSLQAEAWGVTPIKARMGIHTGAAEHSDGDYHGYLTLAHVQRLMSAGYGGQVLLSEASAVLMRDQLPAGVTLRDMGVRRLKDLSQPEHIYQLVGPGLHTDFPALKTLDIRPNNLPLQLTSFIGREQEMATVKQLLGAARLLTLMGAGGTGKTRLSLQVAADELDLYGDGVWFVEFAALADPALVPQTVGAALNVRAEGNQPVIAILIDYLREKHVLLILDNCEHLIAACAQLADQLLHACPQLKILVTSREALGIAGETSFRVPSLQLPTGRDRIPLDQLSQYEAVRLFVDRAVAVKPDFRVTHVNAPAVAQICYRLDGIPLALELAAARIRSLSVENMATRLDDQFHLLTGGSRTALPRHQTLRAAIDWSYNLLTAPERVLLNRLSVFAGGWTVEAAEEVASGNSQAEDGVKPPASDPTLAPGDLRREDVLDLLSHLVDKSLVIVDEQGDETRYRLLETIRQYAREKLSASGEAQWLGSRHFDYCLKISKDAEIEIAGAEQLHALKRLDAELDNLRAAFQWAQERGAIDRALELTGTAVQFWYMRGYWSESRERLHSLLARPEASTNTPQYARAIFLLGWYRYVLGETAAAYAPYQQAISLARELGMEAKYTLGIALVYYGWALMSQDATKARAQVEEGLAFGRAIEDPWTIENALNFLGIIATKQGDFGEATRRLEECLSVCRIYGNRWYSANPLFNLGDARYLQGDYERARSYFEDALVIYREMEDRRGIAMTQQKLGELSGRQGDYRLAEQYYVDSLAIWRGVGNRRRIAAGLGELGHVWRMQDQHVQAARLYQESLNLSIELKNTAGILSALDAFSQLAAAQGKLERATQLSAAVSAIAEGTGTRMPSAHGAEHKHSLAAVRAKLDETTFHASSEAGRALTLEQAVALALREDP